MPVAARTCYTRGATPIVTARHVAASFSHRRDEISGDHSSGYSAAWEPPTRPYLPVHRWTDFLRSAAHEGVPGRVHVPNSHHVSNRCRSLSLYSVRSTRVRRAMNVVIFKLYQQICEMSSSSCGSERSLIECLFLIMTNY